MKFYMLVLGLDTTTRQGSAALTRDGAVLGTVTGDAMLSHGERLPGDLMRLLSAHALRMADVDLFAVASGPGSFTGLRVGIATLQGLALANGRPLVGVSALDALNAAVRSSLAPHRSPLTSGEGHVACWIDAQRGQVFSALYGADEAVEGPVVEKPADVLRRWDGRTPPLFVGDGALNYEAMIKEAFPGADIAPEVPPLAPTIARLAEAHMREHGPVAPDAIRPIYIRRSDAELARERAVRLKLDSTSAS
ncbi:MAG TPA: tRNA (adenosine(37)-N6)-threonylcarbamoyltransferase complex dimerization subunit type 1 TsaB [Vicinamibacterales bacterium]|nr:tRNA (adenosine(37)-N6)-threonylcarbamoyltransferase complex dimerization subunit type 1 TsaB [Vicinamibacterales bacterium]